MNKKTTDYAAFADEAIRTTLPLALDRVGNAEIADRFRRLPRLVGQADLARAQRAGEQVLSKVTTSLYMTTDYADFSEAQQHLVEAYWTTRAVIHSVQMALCGQLSLN